MKGESVAIIAGFTFDTVEAKRIIKSVFVFDDEYNKCSEMLVSEDHDVDKEILAKDLIKYFRKKVTMTLDLMNDTSKPRDNEVIIKFVGIKNDENIL